jgi:hypothetical protein
MANNPLVGQSPIEINYEPVVSATKVSIKRARQVTTKKGAYGTIGSAKGQPTTTGTISLAVPKVGLEIKLQQLFDSDDGFTLTFRRGIERWACYGCQISEDDFSSDYEPGNTEQTINFTAADLVQIG